MTREEQLACLTDRPCAVCSKHTEKGCSSWTCVFEEKPEELTGYWIQYDKRFPWRFHYKCSECGNYLDFTGVNGGRGKANYCPNCGAKMIEKKVTE